MTKLVSTFYSFRIVLTQRGCPSNHLDINTGEQLTNSCFVSFDVKSEAEDFALKLEKDNPDGAVFNIQLYERQPRVH